MAEPVDAELVAVRPRLQRGDARLVLARVRVAVERGVAMRRDEEEGVVIDRSVVRMRSPHAVAVVTTDAEESEGEAEESLRDFEGLFWGFCGENQESLRMA